MTQQYRPRAKYVVGPDGSPLTIAHLPAPGTKRWVIRRSPGGGRVELAGPPYQGGALPLSYGSSKVTAGIQIQ